MKRTKKAKDDKKTRGRKRRFYRSNLSTIVWDGGRNKPLADFTEGHFTTDEEEVAEILIEKGYVEIPLNATKPPSIIINQPAVSLKDGEHVPFIIPGMSEDKVQAKIDAVTAPPEIEPQDVPSFESVEE